jgi:DNA-binding transcriptional MerR regulator
MKARIPTPGEDDAMDEFSVHADATYSIEALAELAGVAPGVVVEYCEVGILRPGTMATEREFDAEALRVLRRAEHLRAACGANMAGLRLMLEMMDEIERLRRALRRRML